MSNEHEEREYNTMIEDMNLDNLTYCDSKCDEIDCKRHIIYMPEGENVLVANLRGSKYCYATWLAKCCAIFASCQ